jgi:hypothetical protein
MKRLAIVLVAATALQCAVSGAAVAGPRGGGGGRLSRPAPQARSAPQSRQGGFNVPRQDYKKPTTTNPNNHNANNTNRNTNNGNRNTNNANRNTNNANRNTNNVNRNTTNTNRTNVNNTNVNRTTVNNTTINRTVVNNPVYTGPAWGWNHGVVWAPAPAYWGGGFWGAFAIGVTSAAVGAAVYGSIVAHNTTYTSYQVQPSSPGATMLSNYHLTQTQCGPPNLVVIFGPNNSVICAYPNDLVSAGNYNLDTATLSLTSQ